MEKKFELSEFAIEWIFHFQPALLNIDLRAQNLGSHIGKVLKKTPIQPKTLSMFLRGLLVQGLSDLFMVP